MTDASRSKLSVRPRRIGLLDEAEDGVLELALNDFALPCRRFSVDHKIAEVGKVSVTAEFLLRLVKAVESCTEEAAQSFFGYTRREFAYVLREVEAADFVDRVDGRLSLTPTGPGLVQAVLARAIGPGRPHSHTGPVALLHRRGVGGGPLLDPG